jgi:nitrogen regulatory protein P-II 1
MRMITAFIRPDRLAQVKEALFKEGITGMSLSHVLGHGGEKETVQQYRGSAVVFEFVEKVKIEIAVTENLLDRAIDAIVKAAQTGNVGDGKIFVQPIERVVRIRTGERNDPAIIPGLTEAARSVSTTNS